MKGSTPQNSVNPRELAAILQELNGLPARCFAFGHEPLSLEDAQEAGVWLIRRSFQLGVIRGRQWMRVKARLKHPITFTELVQLLRKVPDFAKHWPAVVFDSRDCFSACISVFARLFEHGVRSILGDREVLTRHNLPHAVEAFTRAASLLRHCWQAKVPDNCGEDRPTLYKRLGSEFDRIRTYVKQGLGREPVLGDEWTRKLLADATAILDAAHIWLIEYDDDISEPKYADEVIDRLEADYRDLWAALNIPIDPVPVWVEGPESGLLLDGGQVLSKDPSDYPLTGKALEAAEYLTVNPGKKGDVVADAIGITSGYFRNTIVNKLKIKGFPNRDQGYWPPGM